MFRGFDYGVLQLEAGYRWGHRMAKVTFRSPPDGGFAGLPDAGSIGGGGFSGARVSVQIQGQQRWDSGVAHSFFGGLGEHLIFSFVSILLASCQQCVVLWFGFVLKK